LGGFGISRYQLDFILSEKAKKNNVLILQDTVIDVDLKKMFFQLRQRINKNLPQKYVSVLMGSGLH